MTNSRSVELQEKWLQMNERIAEMVGSGQPQAVETLLAEYPELETEKSLLIDCIYAEFNAREQRGQQPQPDEYFRRFLNYTEQLRSLFDLHFSLGKSTMMCEFSTQTGSDIEMDPTRRFISASQLPKSVVPLSPSPNAIPHRIGDYEILEIIGRGGMGMVYKARQMRLKKIVAIKVLPANSIRKISAVARFQREMEAIGQLRHPHVIEAYDAGEEDGQHFLTTEYVDGLDLMRLVRRLRHQCTERLAWGRANESTDLLATEIPSSDEAATWIAKSLNGNSPLPAASLLAVSDACELIRQSALGLQHAHDNGIVHRDIKPSNLMVSTSGLVKVLDLGLARFYSDQQIGRLTAIGEVMGTSDFIAPEQVSDSHQVDGRGDLYSLGCTLYYLLACQPPFPSPKYPSDYEKMYAHVNTTPSAIERDDVPIEVLKVLKKLLEKQPSDRFGTAAEVAIALTPYSKGSDLIKVLKLAKPELFDNKG